MNFFRRTSWFFSGIRHYTRSGYEKAYREYPDTFSLEGELTGEDKTEVVDVSKMVNLSGKVAVVTGANRGLGYQVAMGLAKRGATVHMCCRNSETGDQAKAKIIEATGNANVYCHKLDISDPKSIKSWVTEFSHRKENPRLHILVNNAGALLNDYRETSDGIEATFAASTLGTFYLTSCLYPMLSVSEPARVITVTSAGMYLEKLESNSPAFSKSTYDGVRAYAQTKRAQVELTTYWAQLEELRSDQPKVLFAAVHPGWADTDGVKTALPEFRSMLGEERWRTPAQGADSILWAAITPHLATYPNGSFFEDRHVVKKHLWGARTSITQDYLQSFVHGLHEELNNIVGKDAIGCWRYEPFEKPTN